MDSITTKLQYKDTTLDTNDNVLGIVYKITNTRNGKCYVGQTVTHKLNAGRYRPFGEQRRLHQHSSDALCNTKKKQCSYLNNAIRKNGPNVFKVEVLEYCCLEDANDREIALIKDHNTLFPNGYNLTEGGKKGATLPSQRVKLMEKTKEQFNEKKLQKYQNISTKINTNNLDQYVYENYFERYGGTYYAVKVDGIKSIFVGQHISKEELKQQAYDFLKEVARRAAT